MSLPSTANTLSSHQRAVLVRSSQKLSKVLGDVPRVLDDDVPPRPTRPSTPALASRETESTWRKRKPTHLPPLIKLSTPTPSGPCTPSSLTSPAYNPRNSVLSVVSNAPSVASGSSASDTPTDATAAAAQRRAKLERLRRKLGHEVPATAVFPSTPRTAVPAPLTPRTAKPAARTRSRSRSRSRTRTRTHSAARLPGQADDARSLAFSISSDESVQTVTFTATHVRSPRPRKAKHIYQTGPLPPIPTIPTHLVSTSTSSSRTAANDDDYGTGLVRPRQKMAAGSMIGGSDFKAARRAKREGRGQNGMAEPGELIEMVGFMTF